MKTVLATTVAATTLRGAADTAVARIGGAP
ncbi:hypothetical protein V1289_005709 [Bradyrhizobium sp. AZCC 2289]